MSTTNGAIALIVRPDDVPATLRERRQWVVWKHEDRGTGPTKVPYQAAKPQYKAQSTLPATWGTYQQALSAHRRGFDGIGYEFAADDPFVGIDLDGCRDPATGEIAPWARAILDALDTYAEISPTGTGVKLFLVGKSPLPNGKKKPLKHETPIGGKSPAVEVYDKGRYFAVTGHRLDGCPAEPQERQAPLEALLAKYFPARSARKAQENNYRTTTPIMERVRKYVAKMEPAISGQDGHGRAYAAACAVCVGFNLGREEALKVMREYNQRCVPQWSEAELEHKVDDALSADGERGYLLNAERVHHTDKQHGATARKKPDQNGQVDCNTVFQTHDDRPQVRLPGGERSITAAAAEFGRLLGATGRFYVRGGVTMRLANADGDFRLEPIRPAALCSDVESVAQPIRVQQAKDGGEQVVPGTCSESNARVMLESATLRDELPEIRVVSRCPVLIERAGAPVVVSHYDRETGILASGGAVPEVSLDDAKQLLTGLVKDYRFATPGDRARALAAMITPAMLFGGLLNGRAPIDLGEADESQAGKGYRNKITCAIYRANPRTVTQRATGGVGSVQETFDAALVSGAGFIPFDNFRGRLDLPGLESFLTEDSYPARVPYCPTMAIDPRRIVIQFTSNAAEVTTDLANRCSCVRILKQPPDYPFAKYPEGDLLDHVLANQSRYLGAVFSIVREWHHRGKPELTTAGHDFRRWAKVLGYVSEHILDAGGLLVGHREAQQRIASPGLTWLRDVAIAVQRAGQVEMWLRPHHLLTIVEHAGIETSGIDLGALEDEAAWLKATQAIGRKLGKLFRTSESIALDNFTIERREASDDQFRKKTEFSFFSETPNTP